MADVNLSRRALINYIAVVGDSFAPPTVSFTIDGTPEDFTGATLTMVIKQGVKLIKQLSTGSGIAVSDNALQYSISATDTAQLFCAGLYGYEVHKSVSGVVQCIQYGNINFLK